MIRRMSRRKQPTQVMELKGAYKKDPQRRPPAKMEDKIILSEVPPTHLEDDEKLIWREIMGFQAIPELFRASDAYIIEMTVIHIAKMRRREATAADYTRLHKLLYELAMTPAGKAKFAPPAKNEEVNAFADL
jgi:hypothetical protein